MIICVGIAVRCNHADAGSVTLAVIFVNSIAGTNLLPHPPCNPGQLGSRSLAVDGAITAACISTAACAAPSTAAGDRLPANSSFAGPTAFAVPHASMTVSQFGIFVVVVLQEHTYSGTLFPKGGRSPGTEADQE
jgi:hypothetical protein